MPIELDGSWAPSGGRPDKIEVAMASVLATGGAGWLGSAIARRLAMRGEQVIGVDIGR